MIVPFPAGGATDTLARFLAEKMRGILGQPVIIENIAGAAGSIGVGRAVRSPADGYTLSIGTSTTHMLTGGLYALQFDLLKDLEPIILIGSEPLLIVGKKSLPADDLKGLIAYLKANPDKASVGIAGVGATGHLEAGLPDFFASLWYGLWVPKDTPKKIIARLNATTVQALADPSVKQRFEELGIEI